MELALTVHTTPVLPDPMKRGTADPILAALRRIGYAGAVSLELMNPMLWQSKPSQVAELGMTASSQARIISGIKGFYKYCLIENIATTDPCGVCPI